MNDNKIIDFLNGRWFAVIAGILLAVTAAVAAMSGEVPPPEAGSGVFFNIPGAFIDNPWLSMAVNVGCIIGIGVLMLLLNKMFNFVKSLTFVGAASFFLLEAATPLSSSALNTGTLLAMLLAVGVMVLFGCYQDKHAQGPVFLVMCVLAFGAMVHWAVVMLIPAFLLGFAYLRAMNWRSVVAAAIGLFTPFWIVLGLGVASPGDFQLLELNPLWESLDLQQVRLLVAWVAVAVILAVTLSAVNLLAIYNYRLQLRVYNAFFLLTTLLAVGAMSIDYRNLMAYLPLLNLCLSVQIAHAFTINKFPKRYFFIIALAVLCLAAGLGSLAL